ncbi:MAG: hypothetical protein LBU30_05745, partial [Candidatus Methanoplasma sp.]|nr:hypothetical protein [Candidatus Methanoplasma sp.]
LAVSALFVFGGEDVPNDDASSISDGIFSAKLKAGDLLDTEDSRLISMPDLVAFCIITGDGAAIDYIESILESLMQRPDSYCLTVGYGENSIMIGNPHGNAVSSSVKEFTVTYGGTVKATLSIY